MPDIILPDRETWKRCAVRETGANENLMGCFVLAILGLQHFLKPPRFGSNAYIDKDGMLFSHMQDKEYHIYPNHCLGPVATVRDNLRGLADHLKLSDKDRTEMFEEFRKWIVRDARANQTAKERGLLQ